MDREALDREYRQRLHAIGLPGDEIQKLVQQMRVIDVALDAGCCPQCQRPIAPNIRVEPAGTGTAWYGYQCECGFLGTRIEAET